MRTVSTDLEAALRSESTTLCHIWRIVRDDDVTSLLTDAVEDFKMGDEAFSAVVGFRPSAVYQSSINQAGQSLQIVTSMTGDGITQEDVRANKYDNARVKLSVVDYKNLGAGELVMFSGRIGRLKWSNRNVLTIEVLPKTAVAQIIAGSKYGDLCRNDFGDQINCPVNMENYKTLFSVTATTSDILNFTVDSISNQADGYYTLGFIVWTSGDNEGTISDVRISKADGSISLFYRTERAPVAIGDTGRIYPGCDLQHNTCKTKYMVLNFFRAEPFRPTWTTAKGLPSGGGPGNGGTFTPGGGISVGGGGGVVGPVLIGP